MDEPAAAAVLPNPARGAYVVAGLHLGPDEEGLAAWWAGRLQRLPR